MKNTLKIAALLLALTAATALASTQSDLDAAVKAGKSAYILVYDQSAQQMDQARGLVDNAVTRVPRSAKLLCDRSDPANADFVKKIGLAATPVPLILVCSATGVVTGGLPAQQATIDQLVKMMPSPKKAEIVKALSEGKAVVVTVSRENMKSTQSVYSTCASACQQLGAKSEYVKIDMDDPAEAAFLAEMKVNSASTEPVTFVANAQGQIAGTYTGEVQLANLITAATKKVGGCCPSTVANPAASCAPTKK
jgi:hypothetical protein